MSVPVTDKWLGGGVKECVVWRARVIDVWSCVARCIVFDCFVYLCLRVMVQGYIWVKAEETESEICPLLRTTL